jgi:hypothetical protein
MYESYFHPRGTQRGDPAVRILILLSLLLLLLGGIAREIIDAEPAEFSGELVGRTYTPRVSERGSGVVYFEGKPGVVFTQHNQAERWEVAISIGGVVKVFSVTPTAYYRAEIGEALTVRCRVGKITGLTIGNCE